MIYCNEESFLKPLALFGKAVFRFTYENQETASMPVTFDDCRNTLEDLKEKAGSDVSGASGSNTGTHSSSSVGTANSFTSRP